jgi:hypothetical protein
MATDREIAERAKDLQTRARDYSLCEIPGYSAWSKKKLALGESPAFIANLDAGCMWLLPEDVAEVSESDFEEMLADIKAQCGK